MTCKKAPLDGVTSDSKINQRDFGFSLWNYILLLVTAEVLVKASTIACSCILLIAFSCHTANQYTQTSETRLTRPQKPLKLVRVSGGGMTPSRISVIWDFEQNSVKYEKEWDNSKNSLQCKGTIELEKESISRFLAELQVCSGKVEQLSSDNDRNTLTLVNDTDTVFPNGLTAEVEGSTRRVVLSNQLNEAVDGLQQFACAGFQGLDGLLKEKIPCLAL